MAVGRDMGLAIGRRGPHPCVAPFCAGSSILSKALMVDPFASMPSVVHGQIPRLGQWMMYPLPPVPAIEPVQLMLKETSLGGG